jgi:diguanylate cyclase (GGDEF)-like protein
MSLLQRIPRWLFGSTPKMRRVLAYWAATALLYSFCCLIVWREVGAGAIAPETARVAATFGMLGTAVFYGLLRAGPQLNIPNWKLALYQAQFAIVFNLALYSVLDNLRGSILIGMPVVIVFCAFALRPRQTFWLAAFAIAALGATQAALVKFDPLHHSFYQESVHFALTTVGIVCVTAITGELSRLRAQLIDAVGTIRKLATTDELTLLANRRHMNELLALEQQRRAARPNDVCVALIDVDFFKSINDRYGHAAGDTVLQSFAREAGVSLRSADTLARWGGEEFLLLMPDTLLDEAMAVIARMARRVDALRFPDIDPALKLTSSAGVAASRENERFDAAIQRADEAMYRAKANGRNCVLAA